MNTKKAKKNKWLTQAILNEGEQRLFVMEVSGFGDLEERFTEWSDEQKAQWDEEHPQEEQLENN